MTIQQEQLEEMLVHPAGHTKIFRKEQVREAIDKHGYYTVDDFKDKYGDQKLKRAIASGDTEPYPALTSVPEARAYQKGDKPGELDNKTLAYVNGLERRIDELEESDRTNTELLTQLDSAVGALQERVAQLEAPPADNPPAGDDNPPAKEQKPAGKANGGAGGRK